MSDVVIRAEGLGKKYLIGHESHRESYTALRDVLAKAAQNFARSAANVMHGRELVAGSRLEDFWALKNVSFEIKRGEAVGIIGRNGAGKSTLLKILSRITEPTTGRVMIKGRVASLLEVGTGFHPELTGRENIYLNGAILGMKRAEIRRKFDEIVTFAEVEQFLDTPVKRYSSGMSVRLAFAVAAHLEPEILVIDEVLAVGDAEFQKKCLGKMQDVTGHGRTVLFVSHNAGAIVSLCKSGIVLSKGQIAAAGSAEEALQHYQSEGTAKNAATQMTPNIEVRFNHVRPTPEKEFSIDFSISLSLRKPEGLRDFALLFYSPGGVRVLIADLRESLALPVKLSAGTYDIKGSLSPVRLVEQNYDVGLYVSTDQFSGDLIPLCTFHALPVSRSRPPYSALQRGFLDVEAMASLEYTA